MSGSRWITGPGTRVVPAQPVSGTSMRKRIEKKRGIILSLCAKSDHLQWERHTKLSVICTHCTLLNTISPGFNRRRKGKTRKILWCICTTLAPYLAACSLRSSFTSTSSPSLVTIPRMVLVTDGEGERRVRSGGEATTMLAQPGEFFQHAGATIATTPQRWT